MCEPWIEIQSREYHRAFARRIRPLFKSAFSSFFSSFTRPFQDFSRRFSETCFHCKCATLYLRQWNLSCFHEVQFSRNLILKPIVKCNKMMIWSFTMLYNLMLCIIIKTQIFFITATLFQKFPSGNIAIDSNKNIVFCFPAVLISIFSHCVSFHNNIQNIIKKLKQNRLFIDYYNCP